MHRITTATFFFCLLSAPLAAPPASAHGTEQDRLHLVNHQLELRPGDPALLVKRGRIHRDADHWDDALRDFTEALQLDPDYGEARYWQGETLLQMGELRRARVALEGYLVQEPASPSGLRTLARVEVQQGDYARAADHYDRAIASDSNPPPQVYLELARALMQQQPLPAARIEEGLNRGIARHPGNVALIELLVDFEVQRHQFAAAAAAIDRLPQLLRDTPQWLTRRGEVEAQRGRRDSARALYRAAIERIAAMPDYRRQLPGVVTARRDAERALAALDDQQSDS